MTNEAEDQRANDVADIVTGKLLHFFDELLTQLDNELEGGVQETDLQQVKLVLGYDLYRQFLDRIYEGI